MSDIGGLELLDSLIGKARKAGADAVDAVHLTGRSLSVSQRLGKPEAIERSEGNDIGLRVLVGKRQASVSGSDTSPEALDELVERAVAMAKVAPEDPYAGIADAGQISTSHPKIEMFDPYEPTAEDLTDLAAKAEEAGLAVKGITNSEGGDAGWSTTEVAVAASNGFSGQYRRSSFSVSAVMLAGEGQGMERDYDYTAKVFFADLEDAAEIGRRAGERTVKRLNPKRPKSQRVPVIFDPRTSRSLLGHLSAAINGASIARGTSFLKNKMGEQIFANDIRIADDPLRNRGFRSRPFDAEGLASEKLMVVEDGRLSTWFLDLSTARQLGLESNGRASRGAGGPPSPSATNLYLEPGDTSPEELIRSVGTGLYVTDMMGSSVSIVTGDYSRGAGGFWVENGELAYPVSEITVAGHLNDIFRNLKPASDLTFKYGTDAPTILVEGLTLAGSKG
ncbi:MAG: TldD/PmbA family protein [Nisaea sp.]|uniref:TldD/PmbA family protein n=1 Tax=Nisaea sp. TaxID=2024842 RepID=UPI001B01646E|nr:TldD/PmbA family protein [Nisaea sp.]MBO6559733.1 TldD/PmbA family protein [Nisaea sp.]